MKKIRVGIVGGAGYTGGELIRILINHSGVEIAFVQSRSQAGKSIAAVHTDLIGDTNLQFVSLMQTDMDVIFLCVAHGAAKDIVKNIAKNIKIIDLSADFRLKTNEESNFIYGLPEFNREKIKTAKNIANPGCFATSIQLALIPLAIHGLLKNQIHIQSTTGSTGAGIGLSETSHFSWRQNNLSIYKPFTHQHLGEIHQTLKELQPDFVADISMIPQRGAFTRGIFTSIVLENDMPIESLITLYSNYYDNHPFVHISEKNIDLKQVVNTNKCIIYLEKHENKLLIISMIDNLIKGASGQAVQNMNLLFGLDETTGLKLKATAF